MQVSGLASVKVCSLSEEVPFDCPDDTAFSLLCIKVGELHSLVCDEYGTEKLFNVLCISAGSELAKRRAKTTSTSTSNVIRGAKSSIVIEVLLEYVHAFAYLSHFFYVLDDPMRDSVSFHLFQGGSVDGWVAALGSDFRYLVYIVEEFTEMSGAAPVEPDHPSGLTDYPFEVEFHSVERSLVAFNHFLPALLVDQDTSKAHVEDRTLKFSREGI